jgi:type I restriction enzyme R subunit
MKYLAESAIEEAAIEWMSALPYMQYAYGPDIHRPLKKAVLENRFATYLQNRYPHVPGSVRDEIKQQFLFNSGTDLHARNHDFHLKLSKGIDWSWKDDNGKEHFEHFYAVDYDHAENNDWLIVNQFTIEGKNTRRPDLILFVNGLPLVLFEFKNLFDQDATVEKCIQSNSALCRRHSAIV